jgi:PKD repeat protein/murein tripeptide amidase MpaA
MKSFKFLSIACLVLFNSYLPIAKAGSEIIKPIKATKIEFKDTHLARQLAISFHHAILETNYEQGYIIADLSQAEIKKLSEQDLSLTVAKEWNKKYLTFQKNIQSAVDNHAKNSLAGIPGFSCYATVEETFEQALAFVSNYPDFAEWIDIGNSWKKDNGEVGYDLMVLKITNKNIAGDKPKLLINTGLHAREYAPVALATDFAHMLLEQYETNADIQWIVDNHEVHLLLQSNPDGRKIAEGGVYQRKNVNTNHCASSTVGVDLNRNFAFFWNSTPDGSSGDECSEVFRGTSAESEPETQALSNYARSIFPDARGPNEEDAAPADTTGIHLDIHSYSQLVLWPYGHTDRVSPNNSGFVALGNKFAWFNNYTPQQSVGLYATDGTSDDVSYGELGVAAFTFELGTSFFQQCSTYENTIKPDNLKALVYAAKVVSAPYTLAFGPEISVLKLNASTAAISVEQSEIIVAEITATALQTKQSTLGKTISRIEYSIDTPIWKDGAEIIALTENDGDLSSATEKMQANIDTTEMTLGQHVIYFRAYDGDNNVGVTSAQFITVTEDVNNLPIADFTYQCDILECSFDASLSSDSDGSVTSYLWDIHGNSANTINPSYTFSEPGSKTIRLTITDNMGAEVSKEISIDVSLENVLPVASYTYDCNSLVCSFSGTSSTDSDGTVANYVWSFDGVNVTGENMTYSFTSEGMKEVSLTVTDNSGGVASETKQINVEIENIAPTAQFTSQCVDLKCNFDAASSTDSDGTITSYTWDFNDGASATGITAEHTFSAAGDKVVVLTIVDNSGAQNSVSVTVSVTAAAAENNSSGGGSLFWLNGLLVLFWMKKKSNI